MYGNLCDNYFIPFIIAQVIFERTIKMADTPMSAFRESLGGPPASSPPRRVGLLATPVDTVKPDQSLDIDRVMDLRAEKNTSD